MSRIFLCKICKSVEGVRVECDRKEQNSKKLHDKIKKK